jgi:hypothetical protein
MQHDSSASSKSAVAYKTWLSLTASEKRREWQTGLAEETKGRMRSTSQLHSQQTTRRRTRNCPQWCGHWCSLQPLPTQQQGERNETSSFSQRDVRARYQPCKHSRDVGGRISARRCPKPGKLQLGDQGLSHPRTPWKVLIKDIVLMSKFKSIPQKKLDFGIRN